MYTCISISLSLYIYIYIMFVIYIYIERERYNIHVDRADALAVTVDHRIRSRGCCLRVPKAAIRFYK